MKKLLAIMLTLTMMLSAFVVFAVPASADAVVDTFDPNAAAPTISTAADYIAFFNAVYVQKKDFKGKTITMLQDITLNDTTAADWYNKTDAVKLVGTSDAWAWFEGIFDGANHTLKGAIVAGTFRTDTPIGLFPYMREGTIKNLIVDGFYVCSENSFDAPAYGHAGIGGLIGHAKQNVTVDNVTMKNGIVTCVEDGMGGLGSIVGAYDGQVAGQTLKISNTTVEESVKIIGGNNTVFVGGLIGYVHENYLSNPTNIDLSASQIRPYGSTDSTITLKPIGSFKTGGNTSPGMSWTLKNESTEYSKTFLMDGGKDYTADWNDAIIASGCYGGAYAELDTYTVTWIVDGVTTTESYPQGAVPSYKGNLEKPMTETKIYTFKEWSPAIAPVTADVTYTAVYEEFNKVAVTWIVDGKTTVEYYKAGELPNYKGDTAKEQDDDFVYLFKGWDPAISAATTDVTYTAQYDTKAKYEITWVIDGVETKEIYMAGVKPSYKGKVEKAADSEYTYKFVGWDKEIVAADGDVVYTAQFEKTALNTTEEEPTKSGCGSVVSIGLVTLLATGMAGAMVVRRKKD